MKARILTLAVAMTATSAMTAMAQSTYTPPVFSGYGAAPPVGPSVPQLNEQQLEQLVSPIALYPDPLLGQILPAATYPQDVAAAAQFAATNSTASDDVINAQPWEPSVKALVRYPTVLQMMASRLDWTAELGSVFINQQQDLLGAVQQLRLRAQAAGNLQTNQQAQIVVDNGTIDIVPAANVVYVPTYDPVVVYTQPYVIQYSTPCIIGPWLDIDFDWAHRGVLIGHRWDQHFDVHAPRVEEHAWVRNFDRPLPATVIRRDSGGVHVVPDAHRGFVQPVQPGAFGDVQRRDDVERERVRANPPVVARPDVRPAPGPVVVPSPRPVAPAPRPVAPAPVRPPIQPAPRAAPQEVPHIDNRGAFEGGSGHVTQQQSSRGNASMGHH